MKVMHVAPVKKVAGAERHLLHLLPGLRAQGVDARMLILSEANDEVPELFIQSLEAAQVPYHVLRLPTPKGVLHPVTLQAINQLRGYFRQEKPDLVHTHLYYGDLYGIPAARLARIPFVVSTRHNIEQYRKKRLWRLTGRGTTHVIAISDAVARFTHTQEAVPTKKITTVYHGIPLPDDDLPVKSLRHDLGLSDDAVIVVTVARLTEQKGIRYAIDAFALIREATSDVRYVVVGDGELRQELELQVRASGLTDLVHFLGWRDDTDALLAQCDVFLLPSLWEGFGIALLEAMAHRLPIVCSRVGATPEIVMDGETGYLVEAGNPPSIADGLTKLLNDPEKARRMGEAGRQRLESVFSLQSMIDQTAAVYHRLLRE